MKRILSAILLLFLLAGCSFAGEPFPDLKEIEFSESPANPDMAVTISQLDDPYLTRLRQEFSLKDLQGDSDLDTVLAVTDWVHNLWRHDGSNVPEQSDPLSILRDVHAGARYRCVEYSIVIAGCLNALGIPTRVLSLRTEDMETRQSGAGHVVCEAYLPDYDHWVLVDGQWNVVTFHNDRPVHAVELQSLLLEDLDSIELLTLDRSSKDQYRRWIGPYLYFFQYRLDQRYVNDPYTRWYVMLVPEGEDFPQVFQVEHPITHVHYTHNRPDFYQPPRFEPPPGNE